MYVEVNRSANGLSAWVGDDLLSFFFEEGYRQNVRNITKTIASLACRQALQFKWCKFKPLYFDRAPFQRRSPFPGYRALDFQSGETRQSQAATKFEQMRLEVTAPSIYAPSLLTSNPIGLSRSCDH